MWLRDSSACRAREQRRSWLVQKPTRSPGIGDEKAREGLSGRGRSGAGSARSLHRLNDEEKPRDRCGRNADPRTISSRSGSSVAGWVSGVVRATSSRRCGTGKQIRRGSSVHRVPVKAFPTIRNGGLFESPREKQEADSTNPSDPEPSGRGLILRTCEKPPVICRSAWRVPAALARRASMPCSTPLEPAGPGSRARSPPSRDCTSSRSAAATKEAMASVVAGDSQPIRWRSDSSQGGARRS
jgi:hypothetical protein